MVLYLIRHAIAEQVGEGGSVDDASRQLTPEGIDKMRRIAQALARLGVAVEQIWTSP